VPADNWKVQAVPKYSSGSQDDGYPLHSLTILLHALWILSLSLSLLLEALACIAIACIVVSNSSSGYSKDCYINTTPSPNLIDQIAGVVLIESHSVQS
jgi:hypothetical protein